MAGTIAANNQSVCFFGAEKGKKSTFVITAAANGAANNLLVPYDLSGQYLYSVTVANGTTGPTDNSDLTLHEDSETGVDILGGSGTDQADNATTNTFRPLINNVAAGVPIYGPLYAKILNNSINSSNTVVTLRTIPRLP